MKRIPLEYAILGIAVVATIAVVHPARAQGASDTADKVKRGQEIAAKHNIRPRNEAVLKKYATAFKPIKLFSVEQYFGSLAEAQKVHFNDGGQFDKLYTAGK